MYAAVVEGPPRPPLPWDLRLVAWLYLLGGTVAVVHMLVVWFSGHRMVNAAVVFLPVGWKLLRVRRGWRRIAVIITVVMPLAGLLMTGYLYMLNRRPIVKWLGFDRGTSIGIAASVLVLALLLWQLRVLTSKRTRALFGDTPGASKV